MCAVVEASISDVRWLYCQQSAGPLVQLYLPVLSEMSPHLQTVKNLRAAKFHGPGQNATPRGKNQCASLPQSAGENQSVTAYRVDRGLVQGMQDRQKALQPNLIVKANRAKRAVRALPAQLTPLFGQIQPRYVTTYVPPPGCTDSVRRSRKGTEKQKQRGGRGEMRESGGSAG